LNGPAHVLEDPHGRERRRYGVLSITLHWTIAALIFLQMALGWCMNEVLPDHSPAQDLVQDIHISVGLTILLLVLIRIASRLLTPVPALPDEFAPWESALARSVHVLFYVLMLVLPLSGWLLVTLRHEHFSFWGLSWPYLPGLQGVSGPAHKPLARAVKHFHVFTQIWIAWALIALHVAGALKHQFDGHPVLWRMNPFARVR
jgi:cytochrome b561